MGLGSMLDDEKKIVFERIKGHIRADINKKKLKVLHRTLASIS